MPRIMPKRQKIQFKHYFSEELFEEVERWRGHIPRSTAIELLVKAGLQTTATDAAIPSPRTRVVTGG